MNIVLLGAPGAGKGTQSAKLVEEFGFSHLSTGDLLRAAVKEGTELGKKAKTYMDAGDLVPDEVVIGLVEEKLKADPDASYLLDGFPRTPAQAVALDGVLSDLGKKLDFAIALNVDNEVVVKRMSDRRVCRKCGYPGTSATGPTCPQCGGEMYQREDDNEETVRTRLEVYDKSTSPLIDYYRGNGILVEIDGNQTPDEVYADLKKAIS
jgi:adenylate kinase